MSGVVTAAAGSGRDGRGRSATRAGASGRNWMTCFQVRVIASAKMSSRSPGWASRSAASMAACSSGMTSDLLGRHAGREQRVAQQVRHLVRPAAAEVVVAPADVVVEPSRRDPADLGDVLVAAVAGRREHADPPARPTSSRCTSSAHRLDRGRVVAVVEDHLERVLVEDVHPARRLEERRVEGAQPLADVLELDAHAERHRRGEHRVLHVVQRPALERRRDQVRPEQRDVGAVS